MSLYLNQKKHTSYLFADILNFDYKLINPDNEPVVVANLDENIGLARIRNHAVNIKKELTETGVNIDYITGGLDEYPVTGKVASDYLKEKDVFTSAMSLASIDQDYSDIGYFRCSKSMIINIYQIDKLQSKPGNRIDAKMINGEHVIISRRYAKELRSILKGGTR